MTLQEALNEIFRFMTEPRRRPKPGEGTPLPDEKAPDGRIVKRRKWRESLSEAQTIAVNWVWETCAHVMFTDKQDWVDGFLADYNVNHEIIYWVKVTTVWLKVKKKYPTLDDLVLFQNIILFADNNRFTTDLIAVRHRREIEKAWRTSKIITL